MDRVLSYRMDHRTREDFEEDLLQFHEKEFYWGMAFRYELTARGHPCSVEEHGVDNTGRLIAGRLPNHNVDKVFRFVDGSPSLFVEIKTIPEYCNRYHTFKVCAIKGCWEQGARILVPKKDRYWIYTKPAYERMVDRCEEREDIREFGYKPCYRLSMSLVRQMESDGIVIAREWTPEAKRFIREMSRVLLADRKTSAMAPI